MGLAREEDVQWATTMKIEVILQFLTFLDVLKWFVPPGKFQSIYLKLILRNCSTRNSSFLSYKYHTGAINTCRKNTLLPLGVETNVVKKLEQIKHQEEGLRTHYLSIF